MRYAVRYNKDFRYLKEVDEIIFDYQGTDQIVDMIPATLQEDQRAIIRLTDIDDIGKVIGYLVKVKELHHNLIVQIDFYEQKDFINILNDNSIEYMFSNFCKTYDTLYAMVKLGAKEVYIVESLAFDLESLQSYREDYGIKFRVFPDIAQYEKGTKDLIPEIITFWIRPEDVELYEKYVDTFEIFRTDNRTSVIYEVYKGGQWRGQVKDIICDFESDIGNANIAPHFGLMRTGCKRKCLYNKCNVCTNIADLAEQFKINDINIIKKKKKDKLPVEERDKIIEELKEKGKELNESETD